MSDTLLPLLLFRAARLNLARGVMSLEGQKRAALLAPSFTPAPETERWVDVAQHEVVGPGYVPGGALIQATAGLQSGDIVALDIGAAIQWPGSALAVKWLVIVNSEGAETVSSDYLLGYADLAPGRNAVTTRTGTLRLTFTGNDIILAS